MKPFVALGPVDRLRDSVDQQQAVGEASDRIRDRLNGDVGLRTHQPDRLPLVIAHHDAVTGHPPVAAVLAPQTVLNDEFVGPTAPDSLEIAQQLLAVLGMDSSEPLIWRGADLVVASTDERDPLRGKVDAVGLEAPIP